MTVSFHLDDATLIAHIDRDAAQVESKEVGQHLSTCITCRRRHRILEQRSRSLARWFAAEDQIDLPARDRVQGPPSVAGVAPTPSVSGGAALRRLYRRPFLRAAAAAVVCIGAAMSPLGAVIAAWVFPPPPESLVQSPVDPTVYRFALDGPTLAVSVVGVGTGRVVIRLDEVDQVAVTILQGDGSEEVVLKDARLELRAGGQGAPVYHVTVPDGVSVSITGAGRPVSPEWSPGPTAVPRQWTIDVRR